MGSDSKSNGSDGGGGGGGGGGQIPASVKKVVQDLKEVVGNNCTDSEIYAVLRDCNMDPNEAVQRLLSQGFSLLLLFLFLSLIIIRISVFSVLAFVFGFSEN